MITAMKVVKLKIIHSLVSRYSIVCAASSWLNRRTDQAGHGRMNDLVRIQDHHWLLPTDWPMIIARQVYHLSCWLSPLSPPCVVCAVCTHLIGRFSVLKGTVQRIGSGWKVGAFDRFSLKVEARRFSEKSACPPSCDNPLKIQRQNAHTAPAVAFLFGLAKAKGRWKNSKSDPNSGMNFFVVIFHFSIRKAAKNAPSIWKLRKDCLTSNG